MVIEQDHTDFVLKLSKSEALQLIFELSKQLASQSKILIDNKYVYVTIKEDGRSFER